MKRALLLSATVVLACAIVAPMALAQGQFTPPTPESRVQQLEQAIELTVDQQTQILKIYTDAAAGGQGMMGRGMMGGGQLPEAIQNVLTADQVKQYNAYVLKQSVDRRMTQISEAVSNLTADQQSKMVPILEKEITAQNELSASMMGQGQNADFEGMMTKMEALRAATATSFESILSADQLKQYNAMPQRGMGGGMRGQ